MSESGKRTHSGIGPIGQAVGWNLQRIRNNRTVDGERFTTERLARKVSDLGIPMSASTVTKVEKQSRRVTVDELVAFAIALDVSPATLLLQPSAQSERVELAPNKETEGAVAWRWMHGDLPLYDPDDPGERGEEEAAWRERIRSFTQENRPYQYEADVVREVERLLKSRVDGAFHLKVDHGDRGTFSSLDLYSHLDRGQSD